MSTIHSLLSEYGESHINKTNKLIHWICIPVIMISLIGLLWSIPTPELFNKSGLPINFGTLFVLFAMLYYVRLSPILTIGMLLVVGGMVAVDFQLSKLASPPLWATSLILFAVAWVFQFIGHNIEGKKPSFLKDLQFLLIGPMWLLSFIYKKIGIPY
jgi:uncharacterized membrane protein YGL010W